MHCTTDDERSHVRTFLRYFWQYLTHERMTEIWQSFPRLRRLAAICARMPVVRGQPVFDYYAHCFPYRGSTGKLTVPVWWIHRALTHAAQEEE